jgi:hypothetical protein
MPRFVLGPLLRCVGPNDVSVWVEIDTNCVIEVLDHRCRAFRVEGFHFTIIYISW